MSNPGSFPMDTDTEIDNAKKEKPSLPLSSGEQEGEGEAFPMSESTMSSGEREGDGEGKAFPMSEFTMSSGDGDTFPMSKFTMPDGDGDGGGEMFSMSESADIIPLKFQNEGVNASAAVEPLSPNLFRVMRIVPDKQDYSFVEKVQLPEDEILSLCNKLVPSSASAYLGKPPRVRINFNALNRLSLPAVGFYGDKKMMTHIFRKENLVDESVLAKMEGRLFEPGFYVSLPENAATVVVFYWHEGEHFKEASRKDASCNFIRYLVELCGSVYICVEGIYPFAALAASATNTRSKAKRTRRIQVTSVKNNENDFELLPGFNVKIDEQTRHYKKSSLAPSSSTAIVNNYKSRVQFCEGYHHCCFLTTEDRAPRTSTRREKVPIKVSELGNMIKRWSLESNVDYSRLSNQHFVKLLQHCHPREYQDYLKLKESFQVKKSAMKSGQPEEFEKRFLKVLPEFCSHVLLFVGGETSDRKGKGRRTILENPKESHSCSDMDIDADRFEHLHQELSMILTEEDGACYGDERVLLFGSDIKIICSDGAEYMITLESRGHGKKTLPFIRYEQEINAKCSSQCTCSEHIDTEAKILRSIKGSRDFPLSGESVKIVLFSAAKSGARGKMELEAIVEVVNKTASLSAIRSWVENMVPIELKNLERNISFTAFLLSCDQGIALKFMEEHLKTPNIQSLSPEIQSLYKKFQYGHTTGQSTIDQETLLSHDTLKTVCCQVYKDQEHKFLQNIKEELLSVLLCHQASKDQEQKSFANIRDIGGAVIKKFNPGKKETEKEKRLKQAEARFAQANEKLFKQAEDRFVQANEKRFKQEEHRFVQEWKRKMSLKNKIDTLVTRYIEELAVKRQSTQWDWWSYTELEELMVTVSIEEKHQFATVWRACELTPMKKDINELNSNSGHPIVPTCGESVELVAINPEHESLFKVVVLKSGELLIFIHNFKDSCLHLYRCPKLGFNINNQTYPIHTVRRGFDLLAVDESTRSMALYEKDKSKIAIYKFDESFRKVYWTGVDINLESYKGSKIITWMHLIPGKMELLLVDDTNRVRVAEIREKPMMKAKHISLPLQQPPLKVCISVDGFFFIVFRKFQCSGDDVDGGRRRHESPGVMLEIYVLGDTMSHLKTINLDAQASRISDLEELEVKITSFGSQSQLVLYSPVDAPGFISSHVLKTALAREVVQLQQVSQNKAPELESEETETVGSCPYLGYIYHIFDKFATTPALFPDYKKCITFKVVLDPCNGGPACIKYLEALIRQLKAGKDKDFSNMKIQFQANNVENYLISVAAEEQLHVKMGLWVRKLVCLVPIQIARAENNAMVALKDGLQIPHDISYVDSVSLANSIRFGFYDAVLNSWNGKIKVISSMGKQSSGKSYLLNHLSGSLLDVAGGRCTDGVWMTIATGEDADGDGTGDSRYLYVLLDFEGLGSFERSEQEDMLLSVFNAAVSNLTIFNKKDFHLDKDTESAFSRFQSGINLLKQDKKLFKGLFYIAIKDVDTSDVEDLMQEFNEKISQICSKSQDNFILKMYDGKVEIAAMAPYNRSDYYRQSLSELAETVEERIDSCYDNGSTFLRDLKLIIAQIAAKDWTSIDSKRVAVIVDILRRNLMSAIHMGCLSANANEELQMFVNFDTQEEVPDFPVVVGDLSCDIKDSGLYLTPTKESSISVTTGDVLSQIKSRLEMVLPRKGSNGELWHSLFEKFLEALAERRHDRVHQWISSNTIDFRDNDEVQRLQLEANVALGKVKQGLSVCGCKCSNCFWRCVLEKGHRDDHSCMGSHSCAENCSYCAREGESLNVCRDLAGHEGSHDCKEKNHTCRETCHLFEVSSNCNELCSMRPEHPGQHKCNSPQHMCKEKCSLPSCNNPCAVAIESDHKKHQCHERYCQINCIIDGCSRTCGVKDHFHDLDPDAEHLCGNEHACPQECEMPGICEIFTELVRQTRVFHGQRGSFEYELVSEQNGLRKRCCIPIPPFERDHQGPHVHTKNTDSVHYCDSRCQSCGYFCQLPIDHSGLHDTVHGNMRNARFISEGEDIEIHDRKYKWGERGEAEMCNMYCKKQGRGHIHLVPCPDSKCTGNLYDGSRHETVKYGPDVDIPKDEMTHETFWEYVRFVDPCTEEEREEFGRCNHYCKSEEHEAEAGGSDKSYCTEKLWHQPIKSTGHGLSSAGYITENGHHFGCDHSKNVPHHVIFVIDRSGSMGSTDISPTLAKFNNHNSRLGCVYEAILRFIQARLRTVSDDSVSVVLFDTSPTVAVEMEDMEENVVDRLLQHYPGGGTTYSEGLDGAEKILMKGARHHTVDVKKPVVIFLSDGGNNGGAHPLYYVDKMKKQEPRLILHTIMFGRDSTMQILIDMANKGGGTFEQTLDEIQLARSFEDLAESLKPQVAALM